MRWCSIRMGGSHERHVDGEREFHGGPDTLLAAFIGAAAPQEAARAATAGTHLGPRQRVQSCPGVLARLRGSDLLKGHF